MTKTQVPALGAEEWFTEEGGPALLGNRCTACATVFFPKASFACRNPRCPGREFEEVRLSTQGTVWSYTDARYQPPPPYVATADPYEPFTLAAVELAGDGLVVLGQMVDGTTTADVRIGQQVELVGATLFEDDDHEYRIWKWRAV